MMEVSERSFEGFRESRCIGKARREAIFAGKFNICRFPIQRHRSRVKGIAAGYLYSSVLLKA